MGGGWWDTGDGEGPAKRTPDAAQVVPCHVAMGHGLGCCQKRSTGKEQSVKGLGASERC